jgi:hypothetical protein
MSNVTSMCARILPGRFPKGITLTVTAMLLTLNSPGGSLSINPSADARIVNIVGGNPYPPDGISPYLSVYNRSIDIQRTVIQFDLSALGKNVVITNATLKLFADANLWPTGNPGGQNMEVYRLTRPWVEAQVTWTYSATNVPWSAAGGDYAGSTGVADQNLYATNNATVPDNYTNLSPVELDWNVTSLVQEWYSDTQPNYGLLLLSHAGNGLVFHSRESGAQLPVLQLGFTNLVLPVTPYPSVYPLKISSANPCILADQNDVAFLMVGDSAHSLLVNLSESDAAAYLADRATNGFNSVWVLLLCNGYTGGRPDGSTLDGTMPFTNTLPGGSYDLTSPNEAYFAHVDRIVKLAATNGIQVMLDPIETGGWIQTALDNGVTNCRAYGQYLGRRYGGFPNLLWLNGNDFQTWGIPANDAVITAVALGIRDYDTNHLQTVELDYNVSDSLEDPEWYPIVGVNLAYTYYPTYQEVLTAYARTNLIPVILGEAHYEFETLGDGELGTPTVLRRQEYWTLLSGATGQIYGNHYTWQFLSGWQSYLDSVGVTQLQHVTGLFKSRPWYDLVPDTNQAVLASGYGTNSASDLVGANDYATVARTTDGHTVIVYVPTQRTLTVNMTNVSGTSARAWWFNPQTGSATNFGTYSTGGVNSFTSPDTNDWVLVLDDASVPLSRPGQVQVASSWLPAGLAGEPYSFPLEASGGSPPYGWSLSPGSGPLPPGFSLSTNGVLAGTPTAAGTNYLTLVVADSAMVRAARSFSLAVSGLVLSVSVPAQTAAQIANGGFRFFVAANLPGVFTVEYTTNFSSWQELGTLQYTNGQAEVIDTGATLSTPRFYRVRSP